MTVIQYIKENGDFAQYFLTLCLVDLQFTAFLNIILYFNLILIGQLAYFIFYLPMWCKK